MSFHVDLRRNEFFVKLLSFFTIGKYLAQLRFLNDRPNVVWLWITDGAVGRSFNFTRCQYIPKGDSMP